jgi:hypothetical protein
MAGLEAFFAPYLILIPDESKDGFFKNKKRHPSFQFFSASPIARAPISDFCPKRS